MQDPTEAIEKFREQMACPCGCGTNNTTSQFAAQLMLAQSSYGRPFIITSGSRCKKHNAAVAGDPNSAALLGVHADIAFKNTFDCYLIIKALQAADFPRIRVYDLEQAKQLGKHTAHIHVDEHPEMRALAFQTARYPAPSKLNP